MPRIKHCWHVLLILTSLVGVAMLLGLEKYAIYFPDRIIATTPQSAGLAYEDVRFPARDGVMLHGWLVPAPDARLTLVWFHGNAGNISHRVHNIQMLRLALPSSLVPTIFIFDYRGYGQSAGRRSNLSEQATYDDAEGALAFLHTQPRLAQTTLVYFGRSLGAAVAVEMARRHPPAGLILESPFASIQEMASVLVPYFPLARLVPTRYDSLSKMPELRVPLLILHGDHDEVVPFDQGRRLFEAAHPPKTFYRIPGAGHNDTYVVGGASYFEAWSRFLRGV